MRTTISTNSLMDAPIEMCAVAPALATSTTSAEHEDSTNASARLLPEESLMIGYARSNGEEQDGTEHTEHDKREHHRDGDTEKSSQPWLQKWLSPLLVFHDFKEVLFLVITAINALPVALLLAFAPQLSHVIAKGACLPNGNFVLPGTTSIWDPALFFAITVNLQSASPDEEGWSYTQVKIIDTMWDVIVGRGGQILLLYVAYRVFNMSLTYAMETQSVSFRTYAYVAFRTGSLSSIWTFIYAGLFDTDCRNTWRTRRVLALLGISTVYICSMPTLVSAMTGYAAITLPSLVSPPGPPWILNACTSAGEDISCLTYSCDSGLLPAAMYVVDMDRAERSEIWSTTKSSTRATPRFFPYGDTSAREYYDAYEWRYNEAANDPACVDVSSLAECPPLDRNSTLVFDDRYPELDSPMLNIHLLGNDSSTGLPDAWTCRGFGVYTAEFTNSDSLSNGPGRCAASSLYLWGFSFQMLLGVVICNFIFASIMYGLWFEAKRNSVTIKEQVEANTTNTNAGAHGSTALGNEGEAITAPPSLMFQVIFMATQAERAYGDQVKSMSSEELQEKVWQGKKGLTVRRPERISP